MRYSDETVTNEQVKEKNGEREIVTNGMLNVFVGGDNPNGVAWEMLLDILNDQYPVEDAVKEIKELYSEVQEKA